MLRAGLGRGKLQRGGVGRAPLDADPMDQDPGSSQGSKQRKLEKSKTLSNSNAKMKADHGGIDSQNQNP